MPFSLDPQPKDDEIECGRCGALIYHASTRCPECGVNLYEPEDDLDVDDLGSGSGTGLGREGILSRIDSFIRRLTGKPYAAEAIFGDALDQAALYKDLLLKVAGDHTTVERLVQFEQQHDPDGNRLHWLHNAIKRWERDNRTPNTPPT